MARSTPTSARREETVLRISRRRALIGLATAITVAAGTAPAAARAAATHAPACQSHQLVTTLGNANGAAGSVYYTLQFANLGGACTLSGFPGVSAVNATGTQLGKAAAHSGGGGKTVTLKAADPRKGTFSTASATLRITEALNYPSATCSPTLAYGLRVYPPNQKAGVAVPLPFAACGSSSVSLMSIGAVKAG
jgi:hypothetical protein